MQVFMQVGATGQLLEAVLGLAKSAKHTVGFLPASAFAQRALRGTLLAAVDVT